MPRLSFIDRTQGDIAEDLALDEAILDAVEAEELPPVVRCWESPVFAVVLGASGRLDRDVLRGACRDDGVAIARRSSGGGTVLIGPGALNVAVVLPIGSEPHFQAVDLAQRFVLECLARQLRSEGIEVEVLGSGDLTVGRRKCAGSAQRRLRRHFLVHSSILYDFPLELIARYLAIPGRQPAYRENRSHADFLTNLQMSRASIVEAVRSAWSAQGQSLDPDRLPIARAKTLAAERHANPAWTTRF